MEPVLAEDSRPRPVSRLPILAAALVTLALAVGLPPEIHPWSRAACQVLLALAALILVPLSGGPVPGAARSRWVLLLVPFAALSILTAGCRARAVDEAADALALGCAGLAGACLARHAAGRRAIVAVLLAAACAVSLQAILQRHLTYPAQALRLRAEGDPGAHDIALRLEEGRPTGPFSLPAALAGFLALVLPAALARAARPSRRGPRAAFALLALVMAYALYTTRSMGGLAAACAGVLFILPLWVPRRRGAMAGIVLLGLVAGAALFLHERRIRLGQDGGGDPLTLRAGNWIAAARMIADHPLLGTGPGSFGTFYPRYMRPGMNETRYAHDSCLQAAAGWGAWILVPLLAVVLLWARGLRSAARAGTDEALDRLPILAGAGSFLLHNLVDFTAYLPGVALPAALLIGLGAPSDGDREAGPAVSAARGRALARAAIGVLITAAVALHATAAARSASSLARAGESARSGEIDRAADLARLAAAARPEDPDPRAFLAQLVLAQRIDDPAWRAVGERAAARALDLDPESAILHYTRALYYRKAGEPAASYREVYAAHLLFPLKDLYRPAAPPPPEKAR